MSRYILLSEFTDSCFLLSLSSIFSHPDLASSSLSFILLMSFCMMRELRGMRPSLEEGVPRKVSFRAHPMFSEDASALLGGCLIPPFFVEKLFHVEGLEDPIAFGFFFHQHPGFKCN